MRQRNGRGELARRSGGLFLILNTGIRQPENLEKKKTRNKNIRVTGALRFYLGGFVKETPH